VLAVRVPLAGWLIRYSQSQVAKARRQPAEDVDVFGKNHRQARSRSAFQELLRRSHPGSCQTNATRLELPTSASMRALIRLIWDRVTIAAFDLLKFLDTDHARAFRVRSARTFTVFGEGTRR
jgi:hypothetical protein